MIVPQTRLNLQRGSDVVCRLTEYRLVLLWRVIGEYDILAAGRNADVESGSRRQIDMVMLEEATQNPGEWPIRRRKQVDFFGREFLLAVGMEDEAIIGWDVGSGQICKFGPVRDLIRGRCI